MYRVMDFILILLMFIRSGDVQCEWYFFDINMYIQCIVTHRTVKWLLIRRTVVKWIIIENIVKLIIIKNIIR